MLTPVVAWAQSGIAGVVKDTSGAVLPGVTVEAASPALIEKARTVVTDGLGQFKIIDLRPGVYTVTFTLPGFSSVKRDGLDLPSSFTATVNAEMKVGTARGDGHGLGAGPGGRHAEHLPGAECCPSRCWSLCRPPRGCLRAIRSTSRAPCCLPAPPAGLASATPPTRAASRSTAVGAPSTT